jgi:light-regulated signal transduction histidine kinase (bacteriophytochrome)
LAFNGLSKAMLESYGGELDAKATANLEKMREASAQMTSVFESLQMLFRLTSGEIRREELDISAMATKISEGTRAADPESSTQVDVMPGIVASGDRHLVQILLANLINNAWKFSGTNPSPRITVGREVVDAEPRIFVRDNGVGFDMIDSHRLFGAFQRLHSQSEFPGAGIGLATARRIVNRHGGRIWAEGAVGEGATFYFVL